MAHGGCQGDHGPHHRLDLRMPDDCGIPGDNPSEKGSIRISQKPIAVSKLWAKAPVSALLLNFYHKKQENHAAIFKRFSVDAANMALKAFVNRVISGLKTSQKHRFKTSQLSSRAQFGVSG